MINLKTVKEQLQEITQGKWFPDKFGVVRAGPMREYANGKGRSQLVSVHVVDNDEEPIARGLNRRDADTQFIANAPAVIRELVERLERVEEAYVRVAHENQVLSARPGQRLEYYKLQQATIENQQLEINRLVADNKTLRGAIADMDNES